MLILHCIERKTSYVFLLYNFIEKFTHFWWLLYQDMVMSSYSEFFNKIINSDTIAICYRCPCKFNVFIGKYYMLRWKISVDIQCNVLTEK